MTQYALRHAVAGLIGMSALTLGLLIGVAPATAQTPTGTPAAAKEKAAPVNQIGRAHV